jgi:hypothetical protein
MKYLKPFLESRFGSEDEISDYILELIDEKFLTFLKLELKNKWDSSGNVIIGSNIWYAYSISKDFHRINNSQKLEDYINKLSILSKSIKRWNLDFSIIKDELIIIDEAPEYITEFIINNVGLHLTFSYGRNFGYSSFRDDKVSIGSYFNQDLEFFISLKGGNKQEREDYMNNRIRTGQKYKLKLTNESSEKNDFQIIPV